MLIALILILTWPSPCIQALYLIAVLLAAGEQSKAQHQAQSTKQSHHQAQSTKQSHHLPSAISHPNTSTHHPSQSTSTQNRSTSTHHPSPSTSKQSPTYAYIPLFVVFGAFLLISFLCFCCYFFWSHRLDKNFKRDVTVEVRLGPLAMDSPVL